MVNMATNMETSNNTTNMAISMETSMASTDNKTKTNTVSMDSRANMVHHQLQMLWALQHPQDLQEEPHPRQDSAGHQRHHPILVVIAEKCLSVDSTGIPRNKD